MPSYDKKQTFLLEDVCVLAWGASVQHSITYDSSVGPNDGRRREFKVKVLRYVTDQLLPKYKEPCSEKRHLTNITSLAAYGTKEGSTILHDKMYRIGTAQKLLNLMLKYWWCMGQICEPPHCPVDRIVLSRTKIRPVPNWTTMNEQKSYLDAINAIRVKAREYNLSIANWELEVWERR